MEAKMFSAGSGHSSRTRRRYLVGIDVGGTKTHVAVASAEDGALCGDRHLATGTRAGAALIDELCRTVETLVPDEGLVVGIGVGLAGAVDPGATTMDLAPNLEGLDLAALVSALELTWCVPVVVDNDVNAAALGERARGCAVGVDDFVFLAVGTGIGAGVVSGGVLVRGARNAAGEVGYLPIGADPYEPAHHVHGPLEELVSGPAIASRYAEHAPQVLSTRQVFERGAEDAVAREVLDTFTQHLALAIVSLRAVLDPAVVVLGGGVGSRPDLLEHLRPWMVRLGAADLTLRTSALGADATVHGALELAHSAATSSTASLQPQPSHPHRDGTP